MSCSYKLCKKYQSRGSAEDEGQELIVFVQNVSPIDTPQYGTCENCAEVKKEETCEIAVDAESYQNSTTSQQYLESGYEYGIPESERLKGNIIDILIILFASIFIDLTLISIFRTIQMSVKPEVDDFPEHGFIQKPPVLPPDYVEPEPYVYKFTKPDIPHITVVLLIFLLTCVYAFVWNNWCCKFVRQQKKRRRLIQEYEEIE